MCLEPMRPLNIYIPPIGVYYKVGDEGKSGDYSASLVRSIDNNFIDLM